MVTRILLDEKCRAWYGCARGAGRLTFRSMLPPGGWPRLAAEGQHRHKNPLAVRLLTSHPSPRRELSHAQLLTIIGERLQVLRLRAL